MMALGFAGCRNDFLTEQPKAIIAPDNLYVNRQGFESGLYGIYNLWRAERKGINGASNDMAITAAVVGVDNAYSLRPAGNAPEQVFNDFGVRLNPADAYVRRLWEWLYQTVNAANTLIDRSENPATCGPTPRRSRSSARPSCSGPGPTAISPISMAPCP